MEHPVGDRVVPDCITASPQGPDGAELLPGYVTFHQAHGPQGDPKAMDQWFEDDDPVYATPRDPYHRVDVRSSSRHVIVRHQGHVAAESSRPKRLFETGNPIRYYLPLADVRTGLFSKSDYVSACTYKGDGQHWHNDGGRRQGRERRMEPAPPIARGAAGRRARLLLPR